MIDKSAFYRLSYGLFIVSSKTNERAAGCIANTFIQVTSKPLQVSVTLNKENFTTGVIRKAGRLVATCLSQDAPMQLIGTFGFHSSSTYDKFANLPVAYDQSGIPFVTKDLCARFSVRVTQELDLGTHILFVGEVEEAETYSDPAPMTYAYYHQVKGGKTPPKASSYIPSDKDISHQAADEGRIAASEVAPRYVWRCSVCGHIEYADELPDDFVCPVCGVGKEYFERTQESMLS